MCVCVGGDSLDVYPNSEGGAAKFCLSVNTGFMHVREKKFFFNVREFYDLSGKNESLSKCREFYISVI